MENNPGNVSGRAPQFTRRFFVVIGFLALAGLTFGIWVQLENLRREKVAWRDEEVFDRLGKIAECNFLLRRLGDDHVDEVRQHFSFEIAEDVLAVRPLMASLDAENRAYGEAMLAMIARGEKVHPEYYIVGPARARYCEMLAWQAVDKEAFKSSACSTATISKPGKNN